MRAQPGLGIAHLQVAALQVDHGPQLGMKIKSILISAQQPESALGTGIVQVLNNRGHYFPGALQGQSADIPVFGDRLVIFEHQPGIAPTGGRALVAMFVNKGAVVNGATRTIL